MTPKRLIQRVTVKRILLLATFGIIKKAVIAAVILMLYPSDIQPDTRKSSTLTVTLTNVKNSSGSIRLAVYSSEKGFPKDPAKAAYTLVIEKPTPGKNTAIFRDIPPGDYAVSAHHDENGNGIFDMRLIYPLEGYGSSNNPKPRYGPPLFADSRITVNGNTTITITLKY